MDHVDGKELTEIMKLEGDENLDSNFILDK
jgi:hypothetical protein